MKRTFFKNQLLYWLVVLFIGGMLIRNLYFTLTTACLMGLIPISIQGVLLFLILKKHEYAKIGIKIWSFLFLVIGPGMQFIGRFIKDSTYDFENVDTQHYLTTSFKVAVGLIIIGLINKTSEVKEVEPSSETKD